MDIRPDTVREGGGGRVQQSGEDQTNNGDGGARKDLGRGGVKG